MTNTHHSASLGMLMTVALAAALSGCGGSSAPERIVGRWTGEIELEEAVVQQELQQVAKSDPARLAVLTKRYNDMRDMTMNVEFLPNGEMRISAIVGPITQSTSGKWQIAEKQGDQLKVNSIEGEGVQEELSITFIDDDSFTMPPPVRTSESG